MAGGKKYEFTRKLDGYRLNISYKVYHGFTTIEDCKEACEAGGADIQWLTFIRFKEEFFAVGLEDNTTELIVAKDYYWWRSRPVPRNKKKRGIVWDYRGKPIPEKERRTDVFKVEIHKCCANPQEKGTIYEELQYLDPQLAYTDPGGANLAIRGYKQKKNAYRTTGPNGYHGYVGYNSVIKLGELFYSTCLPLTDETFLVYLRYGLKPKLCSKLRKDGVTGYNPFNGDTTYEPFPEDIGRIIMQPRLKWDELDDTDSLEDLLYLRENETDNK